MASSSRSKKPSSSYDAFSQVDELVSKPVLGSDGAAKWQEFRQHDKPKSSVAPTLPLKRADRAVGLSIEKERNMEQEVRSKSGNVGMGEGYTVFKRKQSAGEAAEKKRVKQIKERIRPDHVTYFIAASTFEGWKHDYVFTTRHRGTGYYWDGMDSVKDLEKGKGTSENDQQATVVEDVSKDAGTTVEKPPKKKKKKKKSKESSVPVMVEDSNNPLEQVANAIQRRNQQMGLLGPLPNTQSSNQKWETAKDPSTGKTYYYCRSTGERSWKVPPGMTVAHETAIPKEDEGSQNADADGSDLPPGWSSAKDPTTQKEYYYHTSGETKWERPT